MPVHLVSLAFSLALAAQVVAPQPPQPVAPEVRAQFRVVVIAPETITSRVYEYLQLVAYRNNQKARFGDRGPAVELELALMFDPHPKMPWSRRDIGALNLILSPDTNRARVEYCLRRCTEPDAEIVMYSSSLDAFMKKLDAASVALARRYR